MKYDISHLDYSFHTYILGPVQDDEALFLFSLVKLLRPKTIVEFGFYGGHSAFNFLAASDPDAKVYSYDISDWSKGLSETPPFQSERFKFFFKGQQEFTPADVEGQPIDLLFMDGPHDELIQIETFKSVLPHLADNAIVVVHDTGTLCDLTKEVG